jgi:XTP/dITP diphosphohydrolase
MYYITLNKFSIINKSKMDNNLRTAPVPSNPENLADQFINFVEIVKILRKECPWDSKQTNKSIAQLLIEETYEMLEAIEENDDAEFSKELGDVWLHVVMHSVMAEERGAFNLIDVLKKIQHKLVTRHPHVFSDVVVSGEDEVMQNWEAIKMKEGQQKSVLDGVPKAMPALLRAERIQFKASRIGFDWENKNDVWDKVEEEIRELRHELDSGDASKIKQEFGDVIFALVNAARFENIIPEEALQQTNNKFTRRFQYIEHKALELGKSINNMSLEEMDKLWDEAKSLE